MVAALVVFAAAIVAYAGYRNDLLFRAQSTTTLLVSNIDASGGSVSTRLGVNDFAIGFTTGRGEGHFKLSDVTIKYDSDSSAPDADKVQIDLWDAKLKTQSGVSEWRPNNRLFSFTAPGGTAEGNVTYTAPSYAFLSSQTTYFITLQRNPGNPFIVRANTDDEDDTGIDDWSIADDMFYRPRNTRPNWDSDNIDDAPIVLRFRLRGEVLPSSEFLVGNTSQTTASDTIDVNDWVYGFRFRTAGNVDAYDVARLSLKFNNSTPRHGLRVSLWSADLFPGTFRFRPNAETGRCC